MHHKHDHMIVLGVVW